MVLVFSMTGRSIRVSVICTAYNHEKYIGKALEGFVNQKTNFDYEVIVHDDASTDGTASIIREYEKKYPDLFKVIYQTENQYSKNISIMDDIVFPMIGGKYVALCEGDDFWIDNNKLQKQVDFLDNNPSYAAVAHNSVFLNERNGEEWIQYDQKMDKKLRFEDIIVDGGKCYHTSSIMFRKKFYFYPESFKIRGIGDYPRSVYLCLSGGIYYFKDVMSVHRCNVEGSWSQKNSSIEKLLSIISMRNSFLNSVDEYTEKKYHSVIRKTLRNNEAEKLIQTEKYWWFIIRYPDVFLHKPFGYQKFIIKQLLKQAIKKE